MSDRPRMLGQGKGGDPLEPPQGATQRALSQSKGDDPLEPPQGATQRALSQSKGDDSLEPPQGATRRALSEEQLTEASGAPGVGPHPRPWPEDPRLDQQLLEHGDRRNVIDRYRYWTAPAIVADLNIRRHPLQIAIQNWEHDFNIGSIVRTANAFNVAGVHIVGRRRWNRRGAMVTDRYLHVEHHPSVAEFADRLAAAGYVVIGVDNLEGAVPLESYELSERTCLVFGSEGPGLTDELVAVCEQLVAITQYGSTRSINAGAAAAIAMYHWALRWAGPGRT